MKKPRKTTDCRNMTPEQKRDHLKAQKLANYHRRMADPAFREARAAKERQRWANGEGTRRNAAERIVTAKIHAHRAEVAPPPLYGPPVRECSPERVAYKRAWRQAHADDLNARRRADRLARPDHYRAMEQTQNRRRTRDKKAVQAAN